MHLPLQDGCLEERSLAGSYSLAPASSTGPNDAGMLALRLLDSFSFFVDYSDSGEGEQQAGLDDLVDGEPLTSEA